MERKHRVVFIVLITATLLSFIGFNTFHVFNYEIKLFLRQTRNRYLNTRIPKK